MFPSLFSQLVDIFIRFRTPAFQIWNCLLFNLCGCWDNGGPLFFLLVKLSPEWSYASNSFISKLSRLRRIQISCQIWVSACLKASNCKKVSTINWEIVIQRYDFRVSSSKFKLEQNCFHRQAWHYDRLWRWPNLYLLIKVWELHYAPFMRSRMSISRLLPLTSALKSHVCAASLKE